MNRVLIITATLVMVCLIELNVQASNDTLSVNQFRQLYDTLLAGKTLVSEIKKNGMDVRKERIFGKAIDIDDGQFEIPVKILITASKNGEIREKIAIDVWDAVSNLGGSAIISEQVRKTSIEKKGQEPFTSTYLEFQGDFHVSKNAKGGFDVHSFGLQPSVLAKDGNTSLAGNMVSNSCFPENGVTKCVLTIRDYMLGEYKQLEGFTLVEPAGGDVVEVAVEAKQ